MVEAYTTPGSPTCRRSRGAGGAALAGAHARALSAPEDLAARRFRCRAAPHPRATHLRAPDPAGLRLELAARHWEGGLFTDAPDDATRPKPATPDTPLWRPIVPWVAAAALLAASLVVAGTSSWIRISALLLEVASIR